MLTRDLSRFLGLFAMLLILTGCPEDSPDSGSFAGSSSGASNDSTGTTSGGTDVASSSGATSDGGSVLDAQQVTDVTTTADAGATSSGAANDAGTSIDAGATQDAGVIIPYKPLCGGAADLVFAKGFGTAEKDVGYRIMGLDDGGFIVVSSTEVYDGDDTGRLSRFTETGAQLWQRTYSGKNNELFDVAKHPDGGFVLAGAIDEEGSYHDDMWLIRTDKDGKVGGPNTWIYTEGHVKQGDRAMGVTIGHKGAIVMVGETRGPTTDQIDGRFFAVTPEGKPLWDHIATAGSGTDRFYEVATVPTGYVAAGESYGTGKGMWAVKVDVKGKPKWNKHFGKSSNDVAYAITARPDGGTVIGGKATIYACMWVLALDENGAVSWQYELCDNQSEYAHGIEPVMVGGAHMGYAVAGRSSTGGTDGILVRLDNSGNAMWTRKFSKDHGGSSAKLFSITTLPDGGFAMTGEVWKQPGNAGSGDMLVVRTDRWGHGGCKFNSKCANLKPTECVAKDPCDIKLCDAIDGCHAKKQEDGKSCGPGKVCGSGVCK